MTAAKQKHPIAIPTLRERATVLLEEILEAPAEEQRAILTGWQNMIDTALLDLAEKLRPKGEIKIDAQGQSAIVGSVPAGYIKMQLHHRGHGDCPCRAMVEALKDA
jgi:hypothetical protein